MKSWLKRLLVCAAFAVVLPLGIAAGIAAAFTASFDNPASAQTSGAVPGDAVGGVSDSDLWRAARQGRRGTVSIPNKRAGIMIQSEGENWRNTRNGPISVYGVWAMGGMLVLLLAFYLYRGRIGIDSGFSGRLIERFNGLERFAHWLTAVSFCVLGLTGLNMLYGRYVIKPLIGQDAFSDLTALGKYTHDYIGFAFMAGIALMVVIWVRDNIPERIDLDWLAKAGGLFTRGVHPPARKFNAGQKLIFWAVVLSGISLAFTGVCLLYPFEYAPFAATFEALNFFGFDFATEVSPMAEMQLAQVWHSILALVMIAVILAHIYIGWLGMEGAFDAVGTGHVDENWAREHHSLWVEELEFGPENRTNGPPAND